MNAGDEPALIEMRFHVKTLLAFASRSCAAWKGLFSGAALAGALALSLAAPIAALADEEKDADTGKTVETVDSDGSTETAADADAKTVTIYHFELVHYDDRRSKTGAFLS